MMSKFIDLTGQVFGKWTVLERAERDGGGKQRWLCRCPCGKEKTIDAYSLRSSDTKQCKRCAQLQRQAQRSQSNSPIYEARLKLGLTQKEMAEHSGLAVVSISNAERENRFFAGKCGGVKAQIKFNKSFPEHRQSRPLFKKSGKANVRVVEKRCARCRKLTKQFGFESDKRGNAFCSKSHSALFRWHGPEKPDAPTPTPRYTGTDYERVKEKRDLWAGAHLKRKTGDE